MTILKWCLAGTYRLAQVAARASRCSGLSYLGLLLFMLLLAFWTSGSMIFVLAWIWQYGWLWGFFRFLLLIWAHYYLLCFALSSWNLERKSRKLKALKEMLDQSNPHEVMGLDLVRVERMTISEIDPDEDLQVLGSGILARNLLQKTLEADVRRGHQILLFAPEGQNFLEEVTHVLRERESEEKIRSFFCLSLNRPEISASYSPFYGDAFDFLRDWLKLVKDSREAAVLERLMKSLAKNGKPYALDDLLVLLKDKRAAAVLNEIELTREYLWNFDSLKTHRDSLVEKLSKFGAKMNLDKHPLTQGRPLNFQDILGSEKYLFIELGQKRSFFMLYLIAHLFYEKKQKYGNCRNGYPAIYLVFPEEFEEQYPMEQYFKDLKLKAKLRIFSSRFSLLYSEKDRWNTLMLPNISEIQRKRSEYKSFMQEINKERERLQERSDFKALFNEETIESSAQLIKEIGLSTCASFFSKYGTGHYLDCRLFYTPETEPKKMEYEPYQKKFKPEDMLRLRQRIGRIKLDLSKHDSSVLEIIHDLKPKVDEHHKSL